LHVAQHKIIKDCLRTSFILTLIEFKI